MLLFRKKCVVMISHIHTHTQHTHTHIYIHIYIYAYIYIYIIIFMRTHIARTTTAFQHWQYFQMLAPIYTWKLNKPCNCAIGLISLLWLENGEPIRTPFLHMFTCPHGMLRMGFFCQSFCANDLIKWILVCAI